MIQRKQTLFLLATAVIGILMLFVPFIHFQISSFNGGNHSGITLLRLFDPIDLYQYIYIPFMINVAVILLSFYVILLYKKRVLQYKLANFIAILNMMMVALFFVLPFVNYPITSGGAEKFAIGSFLPVAGAAFAFLAGYFIKKDEELVRNSDRIR